MVEEMTPEKKDTQDTMKAVALLKAAPRGSQFIYNRLNTVFEKMFDGMPYTFDPHEERLMSVDIAAFMSRTSAISYEPVSGQTVFALVTPDDPFYGVPYEQPFGKELIDRSVTDNPMGRGTGGIPTQAKIVEVKGGGFDNGRRIDKGSRL